MNKVVVVGYGATGREATKALLGEGHEVVVLTRSGGNSHDGVTHVAGSAADAQLVSTVADGAAAIVNCANPKYHQWDSDWPPIASALLVAAERTGATLATLSNLYGYGPVTQPMHPGMPLVATTKKGAIRAQMWHDALAAHDAGRLRAVEVRASDFFGPGSQSMIEKNFCVRLAAGKSVMGFVPPSVPHSWTFVPDVGMTLARVALDPTTWGRAWHVPTNAPRSLQQVATDMADVAGVTAPHVHMVPQWVVQLAGLAKPEIREFKEMRYQFEAPFEIDDADTRQLLGLAPTPWRDALEITLESYLAS
jgi:nucleoside-diphosphate-sugar epimerase